ncbi:hypothetical protein [Klebsiella quasipneumoniae]|uniref:hypothetical protein n=1 Tax=Klebsiella quasipneumoniae TaxID=1463165 RepID=UPI00388FF034
MLLKKYEELENTLTLTNAQHEVDITNIQNSYETQIQANNQSHAKAIQALEDKLNEQELYYERELSSKDAIIEEQRLEIQAIREENDIVIDGFNTTIMVHMEDKNKLNKTINDLKTSKENQRIRFDEIIEQLKKGHEEAISKLKDSNRELTEQIASQIKDITTLKNEKKELETKNKTLNEQLEVRKNEVEELIKSNNALISENKDLNTALELYENDNKERLEDSKKEKNNNPDPKKPKNK